jgi:hypothetical protein
MSVFRALVALIWKKHQKDRLSMEITVRNTSRRVKDDNSSSLLERQIRKYLPSLEEYIVRKTQADRRRAIFGKDPFYG